MSADGVRAGVGGTFSPGSAVDDAELDALAQLVMHHDGDRIMPRLIRYIEERRANEQRFTGAIERHPSPLGIVWGADDPIAVVAMTDRLHQARPDAVPDGARRRRPLPDGRVTRALRRRGRAAPHLTSRVRAATHEVARGELVELGEHHVGDGHAVCLTVAAGVRLAVAGHEHALGALHRRARRGASSSIAPRSRWNVAGSANASMRNATKVCAACVVCTGSNLLQPVPVRMPVSTSTEVDSE